VSSWRLIHFGSLYLCAGTAVEWLVGLILGNTAIQPDSVFCRRPLGSEWRRVSETREILRDLSSRVVGMAPSASIFHWPAFNRSLCGLLGYAVHLMPMTHVSKTGAIHSMFPAPVSYVSRRHVCLMEWVPFLRLINTKIFIIFHFSFVHRIRLVPDSGADYNIVLFQARKWRARDWSGDLGLWLVDDNCLRSNVFSCCNLITNYELIYIAFSHVCFCCQKFSFQTHRYEKPSPKTSARNGVDFWSPVSGACVTGIRESNMLGVCVRVANLNCVSRCEVVVQM